METTSTQETAGTKPGGAPDRFAEQLEAKNRRIEVLEEENRLRRVRELRQFEELESSRNHQAAAQNSRNAELLQRMDPDVRAMLDAHVQLTVGNKLSEFDRVISETREKAQLVEDMTWLQANAPIAEVGADVAQYLKTLPDSEREAALRNRNLLALIAKTIKTAKDAAAGKAIGNDAKARMQSEQGHGTTDANRSDQVFDWDRASAKEKEEHREWLRRERAKRGR